MKHTGITFFTLLLCSFPLFSQDLQLQFSTSVNDSLITSSFLADPLPDTDFTKNEYSSFSSYSYFSSSDVIWFEIERIDFHESLSQRDILRHLSLQKERLNLHHQSRTGLSLNINYLQWESLEYEEDIWERWSQSLSLFMKDQGLQYLEIFPVSEQWADSTIYNRLMDLEKLMESQGVSMVLGIQDAEAAREDSPFIYEIRAFDYSGKHSTLEALEEQIFLLKEKGLSADRILAGIPLYGRNFDSEDNGYWFESIPYREIISRYDPSRDENIQDKYFYNGPVLLEQKIDLCKEYGIGGIKLNRLEWDSPDEGFSLYRAALDSIP